MEKKLYELVHKNDSLCDDTVHVIDMLEFNAPDKYYGERHYRVYVKGGYCFDVRKTLLSECSKKDGSIKLKFEYTYTDGADVFDGFKPLTIENALIVFNNL